MAAIFPVSSNRVSDLLLRNRLSSQFESDRAALLKLQDQISTGLRISKPSDDAPAALRAIAIQRLLEQKDQARSNLSISQSFVAATDNALSSVSGRLIDIRGRALTVVDSTTSEEQRRVLAQELRQGITELVDIGNLQFRGRHLFAGSTTGERPFELSENQVIYHGNEESLRSYVDVDLLSPTNVTGVDGGPGQP